MGIFTQLIIDLTADNPIDEKSYLELLEQETSQWTEIVALFLLHHEAWPERAFPPQLERLVEQKKLTSHQLDQTCRNIVHFFLTKKRPNNSPEQTESGCATEFYALQTTLPSLPSPYCHAQQGVMWALLGALTEEQEWIDAAYQLALWQLNTCDSSGRPFSGLLTRDTERSPNDLLIWNYLLSQSLALLTQDQELTHLASQQFAHFIHAGGSFEGLPLLITHWFRCRYSLLQEATTPSARQVYDPTVPLIGADSERATVRCTLAGNQTGMGIIQAGELAVVNYGPHQQPLNNPEEFGIQAPIDAFVHHNKAKCHKTESSFSFSRPVQLANSKGEWVDLKQDWNQYCLTVELDLLTSPLKKDLVFVYYIQAPTCFLESGAEVKPSSLDRYRGKTSKIFFRRDGKQISLSSKQKGEMEIIPLAGGDNFWGANFLVCYEVQLPKSQWQIEV